MIRNKRSHYGELNSDVQRLLGDLPLEGSSDSRHNFLRYFTARFPGLFMFVYRFAKSSTDIYEDSQFATYRLQDVCPQVQVCVGIEPVDVSLLCPQMSLSLQYRPHFLTVTASCFGAGVVSVYFSALPPKISLNILCQASLSILLPQRGAKEWCETSIRC